VGLRAGLDAVAKKKPSWPLPGVEFRSSSPLPSHYTDWADLSKCLQYISKIFILAMYGIRLRKTCQPTVFKGNKFRYVHIGSACKLRMLGYKN